MPAAVCSHLRATLRIVSRSLALLACSAQHKQSPANTRMSSAVT